jgi:hypothetical protein
MIFTAIPAGLIATFMTGSRSGLVIYFLFVGGILFTEYPTGKIFSLLGRLIIPAMIFTAVILLYRKIPVFEQAEKAYDNFMARVEANQRSGEQNARFTTDLNYLQNGRFKSPMIGVGLGSTYQGATQLFGTSTSVLEFGYVETEFTRILLEGGVLLVLFKLILGLIMALNLSFSGFMRWAVWLVVAFAQPIVYNPHNAAFLLLGIILVDNIIWRQKIERKHQWEQYQIARQEASETTAADAQPAPIAIGTTS